MKKIILFLVPFFLNKAVHAQYVYTIKADSVKITNTCDTAELIIENHTQNVPGFLFNRGRGRTEFRRPQRMNDSTIVIGGDTMIVRGSGKNFANADLTLTGDRYHNGAFRNINFANFNSMNFKANSTGGNALTQIGLDPLNGFNLSVHDEDLLVPGDMTIAGGAIHYFASDATIYKADPNYVDFLVSPAGFNLACVDNNNNKNGQVSYYDDGATGHRLQIAAKGSIIDIGSVAPVGDNAVSTRLYKGDSIVSCGTIGSIFTTVLKQTHEQFSFRNENGVNDFRLIGLPSSSSSADKILVADNNGQVKLRPQTTTRKSATVTGSSYTVPSDIDVVFVNYAAGQSTITLPAGTLDREITIKNLNATNGVVLSGLDTSESNAIATKGAITVKYTGSSWVGISKY